jgi:MoxR-like ATPase
LEIFVNAALGELTEVVARQGAVLVAIREQVAKSIVGQTQLVDRLLAALIARGHLLVEGVPGLAKTRTINALAEAVDLQFRRIQFTPDLLPSDLTGTTMYRPHDGQFETRKGPIFANLVLADEINRAPAKVQSALLEAMAEGQVTLGDGSHELPRPFTVMATQNPIEQEGTYQLPEAQLDRFLLHINVDYPSLEEERQIVDAVISPNSNPITPVAGAADLEGLSALVPRIYVDERVRNYMVDLVFASRDPKTYKVRDLEGLLEYGASPRASIGLGLASRAQAILARRAYVTPDDVKAIAGDVLRHRLVLSYEARAEGVSAQQIVDRILAAVPVP